jgi:hypothetical protein
MKVIKDVRGQFYHLIHEVSLPIRITASAACAMMASSREENPMPVGRANRREFIAGPIRCGWQGSAC